MFFVQSQMEFAGISRNVGPYWPQSRQMSVSEHGENFSLSVGEGLWLSQRVSLRFVVAEVARTPSYVRLGSRIPTILLIPVTSVVVV